MKGGGGLGGGTELTGEPEVGVGTWLAGIPVGRRWLNQCCSPLIRRQRGTREHWKAREGKSEYGLLGGLGRRGFTLPSKERGAEGERSEATPKTTCTPSTRAHWLRHRRQRQELG